MASTSVHLPNDLLERIDRLARETGRSRNRLIIEACEAFVAQAREHWPEGFFSGGELDPGDVKALQRGLAEWLKGLETSRRNRSREPF
jgi:hypothetical protein